MLYQSGASLGVGQIVEVSISHLLELEAFDCRQDSVKSNLPLADDTKDGSDLEPDGHDDLGNIPSDEISNSAHF